MKKLIRILSLFLCLLLIIQQSGFAQIAAQLDIASHLTQLHNAFAPDKFRPLHLRYLEFNPQADGFRLLVDKGDTKDLVDSAIEESTKELLKYFFVGLTLPNSSFWVNLRPDSEDNIIDDYLAQTDIGKILLEADLQLKKDTASYTSPQTPEGKEYWDKLYQKAGELFGSENITIPTLTRPWIVPGEIIVREAPDNAYIYKATLKVMLEQDYLKDSATYKFDDPRLKALNEYSSQLIRELIIPKITKEVNTSKRYAALGQVYYSLILAQWFKQKFSNQSNIYSNLIDKRDLTGLISKTIYSKTTYFQEYQKSFKNGEYNLKEPVYTPFGQTIRSYFSGGVALEGINAGFQKTPAFGPMNAAKHELEERSHGRPDSLSTKSENNQPLKPPKGTPATLLREMFANGVFSNNPKSSNELTKIAEERRDNNSRRTIQRELKVLQGVCLVENTRQDTYYLPEWIKTYGADTIIRQNPELDLPAPSEKEIKAVRSRISDLILNPSRLAPIEKESWDKIQHRRIRRVLIVDDNKFFREDLRKIIKEWERNKKYNIIVDEVEGGDEGWVAFERAFEAGYPYDVIFIDIARSHEHRKTLDGARCVEKIKLKLEKTEDPFPSIILWGPKYILEEADTEFELDTALHSRLFNIQDLTSWALEQDIRNALGEVNDSLRLPFWAKNSEATMRSTPNITERSALLKEICSMVNTIEPVLDIGQDDVPKLAWVPCCNDLIYKLLKARGILDYQAVVYAASGVDAGPLSQNTPLVIAINSSTFDPRALLIYTETLNGKPPGKVKALIGNAQDKKLMHMSAEQILTSKTTIFMKNTKEWVFDYYTDKVAYLENLLAILDPDQIVIADRQDLEFVPILKERGYEEFTTWLPKKDMVLFRGALDRINSIDERFRRRFDRDHGLAYYFWITRPKGMQVVTDPDAGEGYFIQPVTDLIVLRKKQSAEERAERKLDKATLSVDFISPQSREINGVKMLINGIQSEELLAHLADAIAASRVELKTKGITGIRDLASFACEIMADTLGHNVKKLIPGAQNINRVYCANLFEKHPDIEYPAEWKSIWGLEFLDHALTYFKFQDIYAA
jgi:CheY-like chemotaxis protein